MLQIKDICKEYRTGSLVQRALDHVSLNLRDSEFVAVLGPSGSGKTTLLNVIGGLDRYDSGDLVINGISTKKYRDRDWDSYRNHTIGFVFQSYNLIPHQSVLSNVELALTISGIGKTERRRRAAEALEKVGLGEQMHKRPGQMSGGQMQRVAIARALVNDPDILLADEPTGALDSETSLQVMELLKEVARDRLVVMVTHNPELAEAYATRIVTLKDGRILADTDAYEVDEAALARPEHRTMGKSSMSFLTALALSFNNLRTKKARTLLTAFAGSIGIIGIALILSLSTGVNQYIQDVEEETLSEYPLQIQSTGIDLSAMLGAGGKIGKKAQKEEKGEIHVMEALTSTFSTMDSNDLKSLKKYLDSGKSKIKSYTNGIEYTYNVTPQIYRQEADGEVRQVHPDQSFDALGFGSSSGGNSMMSSMMSTNVFYEMPENENLYKNQYDVKAGRWPENYHECVLVLSSEGGMSDFLLYTLGLRDSVELDEMISQFLNEEDVDTPSIQKTYSYKDILGISFRLVSSTDYYEYDSQYHIWKDKQDDKEYMKQLVENGEEMTIVGVVQPSENASASALSMGIGYPSSLTKHVVEKAGKSEIVKQQLADPSVNVFTNEKFGASDGETAFDMDSLFTIDTDKLASAFQIDTGALSGSMDGMDLSDAVRSASEGIDLSGMMDLSKIQMELPDMPQISLNDLMKNLNLQVSTEGISSLASSLTEGYRDYAATHPEADYSHLQADFDQYLNSEAAGAILEKYRQQMFPEEGAVQVSADVLKAMAAELMSGYQSYAGQQGFADPGRMEEHFMAYLATADGQKRLTEGISGMIDTESLRAQLTAAAESYLQQAVSSYGTAMGQALEGQITSAMNQMMQQLASAMEQAMGQGMSQIGASLQQAMGVNADAFADAFVMNMDADDLTELLASMSGKAAASYDGNLKQLGYADFSVPSEISIYPKDFESKEKVVGILDHYNQSMKKAGKEEQVITYTDVVGALMSSVTDIVNMISYVLIAFVAISLVVSSIMIGVITYISVLERRKEIGILRAIGASKGNISQVFNAETGIIGFCAGIIGIGLSLLLLIPGNAAIHHVAGNTKVNAVLPVLPALVLILLSIFLTLLGGLIPSRKAAKQDPVTALRTD